MFSRKEHLSKKTGPNGVNRYQFLSLLIQEFEKSQSADSKQQVLANLANFSYDPINFSFIRELNLIDLFLSQLSENVEILAHFSLAGLCNLSADTTNAELIIGKNGVPVLSRYLYHKNIEIALNALATIIFLTTPETQHLIVIPEIINKVLQYQSNTNSRLKNLGTFFLNSFCTESQISYAKRNLSVTEIPLPE